MPISENEHDGFMGVEWFLEVSPILMHNEFFHLCLTRKVKRTRISGLQKETGCYYVRCIPADDKTMDLLNWSYPEWDGGYSYENFIRVRRWSWLDPEEKKEYREKK
jgi:hypothetical protein